MTQQSSSTFQRSHSSQRSRPRLGSYEIMGTLGKGGFGRVYLGMHVDLETLVAIKVLHERHRYVHEKAAKFRREARIGAQLRHVHIVRVFDYKIEHDRPFFVMDYAPHGSLRQQHPIGSRLPLQTVVSYVKQMAAGLQYAHVHGVIHCDIKPENLLVGDHGEILLSDFGNAVVIQNTDKQSVTGTVPYMAPEHIQGYPVRASDQYSTAVIVFEWLIGTCPFRGATKEEIMIGHLYDEPPSMHAIVPTIPLSVEQVINQALSKYPRERYQSITAFANALERASQPVPPYSIQQHPPRSVPPRPVRPYRNAVRQVPQQTSAFSQHDLPRQVPPRRVPPQQVPLRQASRGGKSPAKSTRAAPRRRWPMVALFLLLGLIFMAIIASVVLQRL